MKKEPKKALPESLEICRCGILLDLDRAKDDQFSWNRTRQEVRCPACQSQIWVEEMK